ncbi:hypothetical protein SAMN05880590_1225 [Rhizobium sp. RU35A]|uniref:three component ABC system middle component n=1 Tax=Rhizobium sp. RU35A TaxID=1907414 RepID=UPI00095514A2|nr:three component ABC system middle component [Rhizobium sp. RU35A]SIR38331.1 hypothetical protein SAMN05880590_1225 [Rhizobium sp. RU35A]
MSQAALSELEIIQNPALGAYLLWRFGTAYQAAGEAPPIFPLAFLVLPIVLHRQTQQVVTSTRRSSGLSLFAANLAEDRDNLLSLHPRCMMLRPLTLASVGFGLRTRLLSLHYNDARLRSNSLEGIAKPPQVPERLRHLVTASEKLGGWLAVLGIHDIAMTLRVDF